MFNKVKEYVKSKKCRSAWDRGVNAYALELLDTLEEHIDGGYIPADVFANGKKLEEALLNGANNWNQFSWGGCSLICNYEIAERLCTPSELKRTKDGDRRPNSREEWLDTQARALYQACARIKTAARMCRI